MRKTFGSVTALVLSAAMAFSLTPGMNLRANDAGDTFKADMKEYKSIFDGKTDQYKGKTVILHSNDVHGAIEGYAKIAELEDEFEAAGAEVITMDAGDFSQGAREVNASKGADAITLMNAAGYEYAAIGNHEFDYGYSQLKDNLKSASFKLLCANILKSNKSIYDGHDIYTTKSGLKIGIFGMDTPEVKSAYESNIKGLTILSNTTKRAGDLYDCAANEVSDLKKGKADIIIGLVHLGMERYLADLGHRSADIYNNTTGIDIMLDGHSHDVMTEGPNGEAVQSTGRGFKNIGVVVIDDSTKKISEHYLVSTEGLKDDEAVKAATDQIVSRVNTEFSAVLGTNEVDFTATKAGNRGGETNTGDLVTDAMAWEAMKYKDSFKVSTDKVVTLFNASSLPQDHPLPKGNITKADVRNSLYSYDNYLCYRYVKGSQLLEALEAATRKLPEPAGQFPQVKGIKFTLNTAKTFDQGPAYEGTDEYKPNSINRVTIQSINGKAFDKDDTYLVVSSDFCAHGSGAYGAFKSSENEIDTGVILYDVIGNYIKDSLGGKLTAERYGAPRGDITIVNDPEAEVTDIVEPTEEEEEEVALKGTSIKKLASQKGGITVTVKKSSDKIKGTEISYSTSKKFAKKATKTVKLSSKKTKTTIKKLKSGKKYYVRVRTYAKGSDGTVYSKWSKSKSIKVK